MTYEIKQRPAINRQTHVTHNGKVDEDLSIYNFTEQTGKLLQTP
jgi:hypothetical protein